MGGEGMSEIKALEKLRRLTIYDKGEKYTACLDAGSIADEIEAEIAERYIELPVDADGVPIRVGDKLECHANGYDGAFTVFAIGNDVVVGNHDTEWIVRNPSKWFHIASFCMHVKPRTLEDVLREMLDRKGDGIGMREFNRDFDAFVEHYADEIRAMFGEVG
jgi:hypothetical protein